MAVIPRPKTFCELRGKIRLFTNDNSIGFGPANNLGAKYSKSDWLLFMNNDLVLTENWDKPFGRIIKEEEAPISWGAWAMFN